MPLCRPFPISARDRPRGGQGGWMVSGHRAGLLWERSALPPVLATIGGLHRTPALVGHSRPGQTRGWGYRCPHNVTTLPASSPSSVLSCVPIAVPIGLLLFLVPYSVSLQSAYLLGSGCGQLFPIGTALPYTGMAELLHSAGESDPGMMPSR